MKTKTQDSISELQDFIVHQAEEDAALPDVERRYQKALVTDVLAQEPLKPRAFKRLVDEYSRRVSRHLQTKLPVA